MGDSRDGHAGVPLRAERERLRRVPGVRARARSTSWSFRAASRTSTTAGSSRAGGTTTARSHPSRASSSSTSEAPGISDPVLGAPSLEERMDDVRAVMDAAGSERAALIGSCGRRGDRRLVRGHVPRADGRPHSQQPHRSREMGIRLPVGKPRRAGQRRLVRGDWGTREAVEASRLPRTCRGRVGDEEFARQLASYSRLSASPTTFAKLLEMNLAIDVREALPTIRAPTLVTHVEPPQRMDDERGDVLVQPRRGEPLRRRADPGRPVRRVDTR